MTTDTQAIVDTVLALPLTAREEVLTQLIKCMEVEEKCTAEEQAEIDAAWAVEVARRVNEVRNGNVELLDGEEAMRSIRKKFGV